MRVEGHKNHLIITGEHGLLPNVVDNVLTYCDWTFGQRPNTLTDRFTGLRATRRESEKVLNILEGCGMAFENALQQIVDPDIFAKMTHAGPYDWERQIREAYCAPGGIALEKAFPAYIEYLQEVS